jgi:hypothetical protein
LWRNELHYWGLKQDTRRNTQPHTVQLVIAFYRRRKARLEVSLDLPFPPERRPAAPVNVIQQALQVRAYMTANPQETCLSAAKPLKIHRKRIAKLLRIIDVLPPDFIEKFKESTDRKILHQLSINRLITLTNNTSPLNLDELLPKQSQLAQRPNRQLIATIAN